MFEFSLTPDKTASRPRSPLERSRFNSQVHLEPSHYVPSIRWWMAEYQSIYYLPEDKKDNVTPLITIPPARLNPKEHAQEPTIHEYVDSFVDKYKEKWHQRVCWLRMDNDLLSKNKDEDEHILEYLFHCLRCGELAIPTIHVSSSYKIIDAVAKVNSTDQFGVGIIIYLEELMDRNINPRLRDLISQLGCSPEMVDLIIDMRAPNYEPYKQFVSALSSHISGLRDIDLYRNFVLIGTAIPSSFANIHEGSDRIARHDWLFYKQYISSMTKNIRRPNFGDHTIVHPTFSSKHMFGRYFRGKIIYATNDFWFTRKGGPFFDDPIQMRIHCQEIRSDPGSSFRGRGFSYGDRVIEDCANGVGSTGNPYMWKLVGISHHMPLTVSNLVDFYR